MSARRAASVGRRYLQDRRGGAVLEFAMLGPVFLMFIIGFFQVAWAMYCASSVRYALHNSARALVLNPSMSQSDFQTLVMSAVTPLAQQNVTVTLTKTAAPVVVTLNGTTTLPSPGVQISTAVATYSYQIVIPFAPTYNGQFKTSFVQTGTNY